MLKKVKKLVSLVLVLALSFVICVPTFAQDKKSLHPDSEVNHINLNTDPTHYKDSSIHPDTDGYSYWQVDSKSYYKYSYGSWRGGPSGRGPATLTLEQSDSRGYNIGVKNTIHGSYSSIFDITSSLGVDVNVSHNYSVSYSIDVPSGKREQIIYRPGFDVYKVVENHYYKVDGHTSMDGGPKISYVAVFANWDCSYKTI